MTNDENDRYRDARNKKPTEQEDCHDQHSVWEKSRREEREDRAMNVTHASLIDSMGCGKRRTRRLCMSKAKDAEGVEQLQKQDERVMTVTEST